MIKNEVRIIGGKWKGRKLAFPAHAELRPTLGRVRETLFNWLQGALDGALCLDLFAGSGALGFEALSRGAASVEFVERDPAIAAALRANVRRLDANAHVRQLTARTFLDRSRDVFDLVLLDPPFGSGALEDALARLADRMLLGPGCRIYFEAPRREALTCAGYEITKHGRAGDTQFGLLARSQDDRYHRAPAGGVGKSA